MPLVNPPESATGRPLVSLVCLTLAQVALSGFAVAYFLGRVPFLGAWFLLLAPALCLGLGVVGVRSHPSRTVRLIAAILVVLGAAAFLLGAVEVYAKVRGEALAGRLEKEKDNFREIYSQARAALKEKRSEIRLVGHYKGIDGTIVDVIVVGIPDELGREDIRVSSGRMDRFIWYNASRPGWRFHAIRRFMFMLIGAEEGVTLHTPYGDVSLPDPGPLPQEVAFTPPFADQGPARTDR